MHGCNSAFRARKICGSQKLALSRCFCALRWRGVSSCVSLDTRTSVFPILRCFALPSFQGCSVAFWLKLPSRLKILVKNSTSVLSIHLDQVPARSVGWPLVKLFPFKSPITCCLDPLFPSSKILSSNPPFFLI